MPLVESDLPGDDALRQVLRETRTENGRTLESIAAGAPVLLVFLRHFGCSYCRQALHDVAKVGGALHAHDVTPVFVHLGTPERARPYFEYYGLGEVERVSDPAARLYTSPAFALPRVHPLLHFLVLQNWRRWLLGGIQKFGIGFIREDSYQMPGVFLLRDGRIARAFRFKTIAEQPDYLALIS